MLYVRILACCMYDVQCAYLSHIYTDHGIRITTRAGVRTWAARKCMMHRYWCRRARVRGGRGQRARIIIRGSSE